MLNWLAATYNANQIFKYEMIFMFILYVNVDPYLKSWLYVRRLQMWMQE